MKKVFKNQTIRYGLFLVIGLFLGWAVFHASEKAEEVHYHSADESKTEVWTCSMHPQIRMDKPGKCPICAMDLIPLNQNGGSNSDPMAVYLTKEAAQLANVSTTVVSRQNPVKELRLYGKVQADERLRQNQVSHISGRIEKLWVNFTGEPIQKGQKLAVVYSPDLVTAQQELLEAVKKKQSYPAIYEASKERLRQWKLTEAQISEIETSGNVQTNVDIVSTTNGIVTSRRVNTGDYVSQGSVLFEISDLSQVWVLFDAYESDLSFLKQGDKIDFTLQGLPGDSFSGTIRFIDPVIDPINRVAKVRLEINNPGRKLKPEMFATGIVKSNLKDYSDKLVIPRSAVLWTGKRSIVYVKQSGDEPVFKMREIELGPRLGDSYVVTDGLADGEEIVTEGTFSVDAAAQLEGKPSMMNQENRISGAENIPGTDMPSNEIIEQQKAHDQTDPSMLKAEQKSIKVSGACEMCKERIESAAKGVSGVMFAEWSIETKILRVKFDGAKTNTDEIQKAIAKVGHDTEKYRAPDEVYNKLPECCLYRN
jgi:Cu(I)/Ag(I) efflux system membrane fusion protein